VYEPFVVYCTKRSLVKHFNAVLKMNTLFLLIILFNGLSIAATVSDDRASYTVSSSYTTKVPDVFGGGWWSGPLRKAGWLSKANTR